MADIQNYNIKHSPIKKFVNTLSLWLLSLHISVYHISYENQQHSILRIENWSAAVPERIVLGYAGVHFFL